MFYFPKIDNRQVVVFVYEKSNLYHFFDHFVIFLVMVTHDNQTVLRCHLWCINYIGDLFSLKIKIEFGNRSDLIQQATVIQQTDVTNFYQEMRLEFCISDSLSCLLVFVDNWYRKMRSTAKFTFNKGGDYSFINNLIVVVASYQLEFQREEILSIFLL